MRSRPIGRCLFLAIAAAAIYVSGLRPAYGADSPWLYGIHWFGPLSNASDVSQMTGGKSIWVVETVMTTEGAGQWGPQGQLANFQQEVGLGHTLIIRVQPAWGKAFPWPEDTDPSMAGFLDQVTQMATLYKDVCHIWFLGNEMNLTFEWGGRALSPEAYVDAAAQFSDRIKSVTSSLGRQIVLVGPAAVGDTTDGTEFMGNTDYINRMCDRINNTSVRGKFDGFAMHAYGAAVNDGYMDLNRNLEYFETLPGCGYQYQLGLLDAKGFANYPVYITEWNRYTGVGNSSQEYVTAQFLHNAFTRLNTWNQTHHPIVCACWFIYPNDSSWLGYSLLRMKNNGTQDEDAWHAFQYAAGFNYPAGTMTTPVIERSPASWSRSVFSGQSLPDDSFTVRNTGVGTLSYAITDNAAWLSTSPIGGTSTGETDTISVIYSPAGLAAGTHNATITIADANANNSPQTIAVTLIVKPIPGDFDGDGDVDQEDFGHLQACLTGPGVPQTDPNCQDTKLNTDDYIDLRDLNIFLRCISGSRILADPNCAN